MVSGVDRGTGVLGTVEIVEVKRGGFGKNLGRPVVTDGDGEALFPSDFVED